MPRAALVLLAAAVLVACAHDKAAPAPRPLPGGEATADHPLRVGSIADEYSYVRAQRCQGGGAYRVTSQSLLRGDHGCMVDKLEVECGGKVGDGDRGAFYFALCEEAP